jgi:sulfatase maturation enzyme AslB (radical SAM superfamily)
MENIHIENQHFSTALGSIMRKIQKDYSCDFPTFYFVDPSTVCNLRCAFCPTGLHSGKIGTGFMSLESYRTILKKICPYAKEINLYNYGEPFLNENLIDFISLTTEKKIKTVIHSNLNARLFDEREARAIVQSGLSELSVSLDGATQDTYERYRVGGNKCGQTENNLAITLLLCSAFQQNDRQLERRRSAVQRGSRYKGIAWKSRVRGLE